MNGSIFLFAHDVLDETTDVVLDRLQAAGIGGAVMAAAYHHSRDVFPHNPRRKVAYLEGGTVYFQPDVARYAELRPKMADVARETDALGVLRDAAEQRGLRTSAWVVVLHNTRLAMAAPKCAPVTALGDQLLNSLCPANPVAREYAAALVSDVARYGLDSIQLEALSYMPFDHGYHHERSFVPLSPNIRLLLGLCFCEHCLSHARAAGVDADRVRAWVAARIASVLESAANETLEAEVEEDLLRAECDGELGRFLDVRLTVVTSLAQRVTEAVRTVAPKTNVVFLDLSGATLGYATGRPTTDAAAVSIAWRDGIDMEALANVCDGIGMLGYFAELDRFEREVGAYLAAVPVAKLEVILRPMPPDSRSAHELAAKTALLRQLGIRDVAFYHYGMMRLEALEWIREALAGT